MHRQRAGMTLDKHAIHGAGKGFAVVCTAKHALADSADVKPMGGKHGLNLLLLWQEKRIRFRLYAFACRTGDTPGAAGTAFLRRHLWSVSRRRPLRPGRRPYR